MSEDEENQKTVENQLEKIKKDIEEYEKKKEDTNAHNLDEEVRKELVKQAKKELKEEMEAEKKQEEEDKIKEELEKTKDELKTLKEEKEDFKSFVTNKLDSLSESKAVHSGNNKETKKNIDDLTEPEIDEYEEALGKSFFGDEGWKQTKKHILNK